MATNILENGVEIEGSISFAGDLLLDCKINGEITSEKGALTLNPNSNVKGNIQTGQLAVHGKIDGSIQAETCLLQSTADVKADLAYKSLGIEQGAKMVGSTKILG